MRAWRLLGAVALLCGGLLGALAGCGHNPNHDISMGEARAAARRVHMPPKPGTKVIPGHGG